MKSQSAAQKHPRNQKVSDTSQDEDLDHNAFYLQSTLPNKGT